jgi:uncharacterized phage-associated protein
MIDIFRAADYFVDFGMSRGDENDITNLKLNKLLYFAQGISLIGSDEPLFQNEIEAWQYGPVIVDVYNKYRKSKENEKPISVIDKTINKDFTDISDYNLDILDTTIDNYGNCAAWYLTNLTHLPDSPWSRAMNARKLIISVNDIKEWFNNPFYSEKDINHLGELKSKR